MTFAPEMKLENATRKFNKKQVKDALQKENEYISDLLISLDVPDSIEDDADDLYLTKSKNIKPLKRFNNHFKKDEEVDLTERKDVILNKMRSKGSKISLKKIKKREKNVEKKLKIKVKSALKQEHNRTLKEEKVNPSEIPKRVEPVFNEDGKIVFSKIDFASHPGAKSKKTKRDKVMKNPAQVLKTIKEQKKTISELAEKGERDKALELKKDIAWKKAFNKTEGKKVKDDPNLLLKAVKRKKDIKNKSKKKWNERKQKVEQTIAKQQQKRQENINKRIKEKKSRKLKRASKKGRVIPGY